MDPVQLAAKKQIVDVLKASEREVGANPVEKWKAAGVVKAYDKALKGSPFDGRVAKRSRSRKPAAAG